MLSEILFWYVKMCTAQKKLSDHCWGLKTTPPKEYRCKGKIASSK